MQRRDFLIGTAGMLTGVGSLLPMENAISTFISSPTKQDRAMALYQGVTELTPESPPHVKEQRWSDFLQYLRREFAPNPEHEAEMRQRFVEMQKDPDWRDRIMEVPEEIPEVLFAIGLARMAAQGSDGCFMKTKEWEGFARPIARIVLGTKPTVH